MIKRSHNSEPVESSWITTTDAFARTFKVASATLAATGLLFAEAPEPAATKPAPASATVDQNDCHDLAIDKDATMEQVIYSFSTYFPNSNSFEAFKEYSIDRNLSPITKLPESIMTICLTPEGQVDTIASNPPVVVRQVNTFN